MYATFRVINYYDEKRYNDLKNNGLETIGKVSPRIGRVQVHYMIDKVTLSNFSNSPFSGIGEGEFFFMKVDKKDYKNIFVEFHKPVIPKKDLIYFRFTNIFSFDNDLLTNNDVVFKYYVENILYKRFQKLPKKKQLNPSLFNSNEVIYDVRNPQIAYLKSFVYFVD